MAQTEGLLLLVGWLIEGIRGYPQGDQPIGIRYSTKSTPLWFPKDPQKDIIGGSWVLAQSLHGCFDMRKVLPASLGRNERHCACLRRHPHDSFDLEPKACHVIYTPDLIHCQMDENGNGVKCDKCPGLKAKWQRRGKVAGSLCYIQQKIGSTKLAKHWRMSKSCLNTHDC